MRQQAIGYNGVLAMWPEASTTRELLELAGGGDAEAMNALLSRHREPVRRMVRLHMDPFLARRLDASDIVQDVLVEAHRRLVDYIENPAMPFHLWLRRLARDHLIAAYRRHRRARKRSVDRERPIHDPVLADRSSLDLAPQLVAPGLTPAAAAIRRELQQRFVAALEGMSDEDREMIVMRHFEQLSNQEIARTLGLSEPATGMRYLRALRRLRVILRRDAGEASTHGS